MRFSCLSVVGMAVMLLGCGGGDSAQPEAPAAGRSAGADAGRVVATPMPDRATEPMKFWEWRVEQLVLKQDADGDGRLDSTEFGNAGGESNFARIDANSDGFVTKQEILDDLIPKLRQNGDLP